ncbi:unnamed protein product [Menidia menidia]|uniref:(Atlantic silverside) hypothetical protein n=1 Tax=Menidia menidia TaxID=238744 RepID=A0A8S4ACQ0_9TELE|nr:unnamed protein product [Menidia menidia]
MESEANCSSHCDPPLCFIQSGFSRQEGTDILQKLCRLNTLEQRRQCRGKQGRLSVCNNTKNEEMATAAGILSKEQLLCPICLDVFNQPVSTPCGHNFCRGCIQRYWQIANLPQCPVCKHRFFKRPDLKVNTFISEVASQFMEIGEKQLQAETSSACQPSGHRGDISCDVCVGKKVKALKSCLDCLASFCETHLEPHHVVGALKKHRLINPMLNMQERICKKHESLLDLFCLTDQMYVCQVCMKSDHKDHLTAHIEDKSRDVRVQIGRISVEVQKLTQQRLQKISELSQAVQLSERKSEGEVEESLHVFNKLLQLVQRGQTEVTSAIKAKQRQVEITAGGIKMQLEQEVSQLTCRSSELELLKHTEDDLYLLKNHQALCTMPAIREWPDTLVQSAEYVGPVRRAVRRAASQVEETVKTEVRRLCEAEFKRARRYAVDVTLDPDTAHPKLALSADRRQVHHRDVALSLPDNPERFYPCVSVLGKEGFSSGRFYFEVQVKGKTEWDIGVGLESVNRKGGNLLSPERGFWTLALREDGRYWALSSPPVCVPLVEKPQRVGVYVDVGWGQVSFYNADSHSHIYTFTEYTFSERLFPYFNPRRNHGGVNSAPLVILPGNLAVELPKHSLSPVLSVVVWTLLSCGILLAFCFLFFTLRFKNNRIVKMSSPNLNVLTLLGSVLAYISGFLFAFSDRALSQGGASTAVLQARMWTLCLGSTLVFGPILAKTWRLYRVFTQRVPDKRVIIRDIQLIGMVALLVLADILVLTAWNLADPVKCSRSVGAVVQLMERDTSFSLSQKDSCSSVYSNMWIIVIAVQKGCLLLYGTYLAGLTSSVSHPPVNQSPTILTAVSLVTFSSVVAVPVSIFLQSWPNLVYGIVAGAIFICTLATDCVLFVPQLTQWRQFEEDQNNPSQMAKYFSSPSKSQPSVYSQDEIYYLLGENSSMKKLLSEKNAVIDSLQEQVTNAKDKLLRLMTASQPLEDQDVGSSATNLNTSSSQTTELQSEGPSSSSLTQKDIKFSPSSPLRSHSLTPVSLSSNAIAHSSEPSSVPNSLAAHPICEDIYVNETQRSVPKTGPTGTDATDPRVAEGVNQPEPFKFPGRTAEETVRFVTSLQAQKGVKPPQVEIFDSHSVRMFQMGPNSRPAGFVSSEQLQEILQELSVDAVTETALRSPGQTSRTPSLLKLSTLSPLSLQSSCSPHPPVLFRYPSISPYTMRKRRPPFHSSRRALAPPCFYSGSGASKCRKTRGSRKQQNPETISVDEIPSHEPNNGSEAENEEEQEEDADGQEIERKCQRCISRSHKSPAPHDMEEGGESEQHHQHVRDSSGYWDSDSSSSADYCYYHRPYCDSCLQRGSLLCSDSSSDSSDSEYDGFTGLYRASRPVVFKDDLKPTFV